MLFIRTNVWKMPIKDFTDILCKLGTSLSSFAFTFYPFLKFIFMFTNCCFQPDVMLLHSWSNSCLKWVINDVSMHNASPIIRLLSYPPQFCENMFWSFVVCIQIQATLNQKWHSYTSRNLDCFMYWNKFGLFGKFYSVNPVCPIITFFRLCYGFQFQFKTEITVCEMM